MNWQVFEDKVFSCDWRVEAIDENQGAVYVTIFSGPNAEERAHEYEKWQLQQRREPMVQHAEAD